MFNSLNKNITLLVVLAASSIFFACNKADEKVEPGFQLTDDLGNKIFFDRTPQTIISSAPNLTEILFKLGLGDKIIGVTSLCDFPHEAKSKEIVGDLLNLNFERIISLSPDILFITVEGNTKESYNKLTELGINVFVTNPRNLAGIDKTILDLGKIFELEKRAVSIKQDFMIRKNHIREKLNSHNRSAMFIVSLSPLIVAGKNTFIDELLTVCGLYNIAEKSILPYPVFSREEVLKKNPDIIITTLDLVQNIDGIIKYFPEWKNVSAVNKNQILLLPSDVFLRPGPRYIDAIEILYDNIKNF